MRELAGSSAQKVFGFIMLILFSLSSAHADARIDAELKDTRHLSVPLEYALGKEVYDEAMQSGEYKYSGNRKCRLCHRDFFLGRKNDAHEHTFRDNVDKKYRKEPRCLLCHTTGYAVPTGFSSVQASARLANVQCEGCHGPGSKHNKLDAKGGLLAGQDKPEIIKRMCVACHNERWNKSYNDLDKAYERYKEAEAAAARPAYH